MKDVKFANPARQKLKLANPVREQKELSIPVLNYNVTYHTISKCLLTLFLDFFFTRQLFYFYAPLKIFGVKIVEIFKNWLSKIAELQITERLQKLRI